MSAVALGAAGAYMGALYAGHWVGDYWVQTEHQVAHKGDAGVQGVLACLAHVGSYWTTQGLFVMALWFATGSDIHPWALLAGLLVSGVTHYAADRREHGLMFWLARRMTPWNREFLELGKPQRRAFLGETVDGTMLKVEVTDAPTLGTGAWALDQSWHIFWGVFVAGLVIAGLS